MFVLRAKWLILIHLAQCCSPWLAVALWGFQAGFLPPSYLKTLRIEPAASAMQGNLALLNCAPSLTEQTLFSLLLLGHEVTASPWHWWTCYSQPLCLGASVQSFGINNNSCSKESWKLSIWGRASVNNTQWLFKKNTHTTIIRNLPSSHFYCPACPLSPPLTTSRLCEWGAMPNCIYGTFMGLICRMHR